MLKSHQREDLTPAETKVDYLSFAKVLYKERDGLKQFIRGNGSTLFYLFYFIILPHTINYKQNKSDNK